MSIIFRLPQISSEDIERTMKDKMILHLIILWFLQSLLRIIARFLFFSQIDWLFLWQ